MSAPEENNAGEITITGPGGFIGRARGYRLGDVVCVVTFGLAGYCALVLVEHRREVEKGDGLLLIEVRKSNKDTADAVKENTQVLRQTNEALRELICVTTIPLDRRLSNSDVCKRIARGEQANGRTSN